MKAEYTPNIAYPNNPFIEALPPMLSKRELIRRISALPEPNISLRELPEEERLPLTNMVKNVFWPMSYAVHIYTQIYLGIQQSLSCKNNEQAIRQLHRLYEAKQSNSNDVPVLSSQTVGLSILGVPGIGKTSTITRILNLIPQCITHTEYNGKPFVETQINYINVQCPSDCSVKSLCLSILSQIENVVLETQGVDLHISHHTTVDVLVLTISQLCITYHVGIIIIDEIQNIIPSRSYRASTAEISSNDKLVNCLVQLMNSTGVCLAFVGTPEAESKLDKKAHLFRRTRGIRLNRLSFGPDFMRFVDCLWQHQYTKKVIEPTPAIYKKLYDLSGGVPANISLLLSYAQQYAILNDFDYVDEDIIDDAAALNSMSYKPFDGTTLELPHKSSPHKTRLAQQNISIIRETPHFVETNTRGRPKSLSDSSDLISVLDEFKTTKKIKLRLEELECLNHMD